MGMKVVCPVLVMITISMLGCASLEKSDECMSARQRFENEGLNIDQFRGDRTSDEFVRRAKGLAMFHYFPSRYGTQFEKVSDFAVFSCGPVEGARTKRRVPSTMDLLDQDRPGIRLEDSILGEFADGHRELLAAANLVKRLESLKLSFPSNLSVYIRRKGLGILQDKTVEQIISVVKAAQSTDISKTETEELIIEYPSQAGHLKEDAQNARKKYLQQRVEDLYENNLEPAVFFNPQIQMVLSEKIPRPLSDEEADVLCGQMFEQLSKVGLTEALTYRVPLATGGTKTHGGCRDALIGGHHGDLSAFKRELLQDTFYRAQFTKFLLATAVELEPKRISPDKVSLKVTIAWPKVFNDKYFIKVSEVSE